MEIGLDGKQLYTLMVLALSRMESAKSADALDLLVKAKLIEKFSAENLTTQFTISIRDKVWE